MPTIDTVDPATGRIERLPINVGKSTWRAVLGANALHLVIREGDLILLNVEVDAPNGAPVEVCFVQHGQEWAAKVENRAVLRLPRNEPECAHVLFANASRNVDIFFLIDGTSLHPAGDKGDLQPLIGSTEWEPVRLRLLDILKPLEDRGVDLHTGVGSFADTSILPGIESYLLHPREWRLAPTSRTRSDWSLPKPADGGDFVDALADGLHACRQLPWRTGSRKLVVLFGDSPGYCVSEAGRSPIDLADCHLRELDVFEEADALHLLGVELATVYHSPSGDALAEVADYSRELVSYARRQYERLASNPDWALTSPAWDPTAFSEQWYTFSGPLARGVAPPLGPTTPP